jgi:hypothetical protein
MIPMIQDVPGQTLRKKCLEAINARRYKSKCAIGTSRRSLTRSKTPQQYAKIAGPALPNLRLVTSFDDTDSLQAAA